MSLKKSMDIMSRIDDYSDRASKKRFTQLWGQNVDETASHDPQALRKVRVYLCGLLWTRIPDEALGDVAEDIFQTIQYFEERDELLCNSTPRLPLPRITLSLGETRSCTPVHLPVDDN